MLYRMRINSAVIIATTVTGTATERVVGLHTSSSGAFSVSRTSGNYCTNVTSKVLPLDYTVTVQSKNIICAMPFLEKKHDFSRNIKAEMCMFSCREHEKYRMHGALEFLSTQSNQGNKDKTCLQEKILIQVPVVISATILCPRGYQ